MKLTTILAAAVISADTGDGALAGIFVALAACIITAFVTLRLTKYKNRK